MLGSEKVITLIKNNDKFLLKVMQECPYCPSEFGLTDGICDETNCKECWRSALKEEVEE